MKPSFSIPGAEIAIMENSLLRLVTNSDDNTFRSGLPAERWPQPSVGVIDGAFSRSKLFWRDQHRRAQGQRALNWLLQKRGLA